MQKSKKLEKAELIDFLESPLAQPMLRQSLSTFMAFYVASRLGKSLDSTRIHLRQVEKNLELTLNYVISDRGGKMNSPSCQGTLRPLLSFIKDCKKQGIKV
ncbi:MAG: hypothetical protein ACOYOK_01800 [Pseudobdellovibrionaceae bacterium]